MQTINELKQAVNAEPARSAWDKGRKMYAVELLDELEEAVTGGHFNPENISDRAALEAQMLNGADSWSQYSYGGRTLIYEGDIAARLCSPSEYKRSHEGERRPNGREEWLDVQARALGQAANIIIRLARQGGHNNG